MPGIPAPKDIAAALAKRVIGQADARTGDLGGARQEARPASPSATSSSSAPPARARRRSCARSRGCSPRNPALAIRSTVVRVHANVLGEEAEQGQPGEKLLRRLLERARQQLGLGGARGERLLEQATHGLVFVDEVDKIRSVVGGQPNLTGIRAQEALLTLIENEAVPFTLPEWAGAHRQPRLERPPLRVRGGLRGALRRGLQPRDRRPGQGRPKPVTVMEGGLAREELQFSLRDWLQKRGPLRVRRQPAVPLALRRGRAARAPGRGGAPARPRSRPADSGLAPVSGLLRQPGIKLEITPAAAAAASRRRRLDSRGSEPGPSKRCSGG